MPRCPAAAPTNLPCRTGSCFARRNDEVVRLGLLQTSHLLRDEENGGMPRSRARVEIAEKQAPLSGPHRTNRASPRVILRVINVSPRIGDS